MHEDSKKKWTVMVYLAGDNELNDDMVTSLTRLHSLRGNLGCNIFAYYATSNLPRESVLYDFRNKEYEIEPLEKCARERLGDVSASTMGNSAEVKTLVDFVRACHQVSPTEHNVLILSGHSDGFLGRSLLEDETSKSVMGFLELKRALKEIKLILRSKLDILGFDSCTMGMVEVAYELQKCAQVLITPQDFTPSSGWNYNDMLSTLVEQNPCDNPVKHAKNFVEKYVCYERDFVVGGRSVEIAACLLNADLKQLVRKIKRLADRLRKELPPVRLPHCPTEDGTYGDDEEGIAELGVFYSRYIDLILSSHWFSQTHMQDQSVDLLHFCVNLYFQCEKLKKQIEAIIGHPIPPEDPSLCNDSSERDQGGGDVADLLRNLFCIQSDCVEIRKILRGVDEKPGIVIANNHAGFRHQFSYGLSLFFPWSRLAFVLSYKAYKKLKFTRKEGKSWLSLINRFTAETIQLQFNDISNFIPPILKEGLGDPSGTKYNPPGRGALAEFREKFGRVKNYPMKDLHPPKCHPPEGDEPACDEPGQFDPDCT